MEIWYTKSKYLTNYRIRAHSNRWRILFIKCTNTESELPFCGSKIVPWFCADHNPPDLSWPIGVVISRSWLLPFRPSLRLCANISAINFQNVQISQGFSNLQYQKWKECARTHWKGHTQLHNPLAQWMLTICWHFFNFNLQWTTIKPRVYRHI